MEHFCQLLFKQTFSSAHLGYKKRNISDHLLLIKEPNNCQAFSI